MRSTDKVVRFTLFFNYFKKLAKFQTVRTEDGDLLNNRDLLLIFDDTKTQHFMRECQPLLIAPHSTQVY